MTELIMETQELPPVVVGVRFSPAGQVFFYQAVLEDIRPGAHVLVEVPQGVLLGEVCIVSMKEQPETSDEQTGRVIGFATAKDLATETENRLLAAEAAAFCKSCIREHHLDMKLVHVEVLHDRSKMLFYFTAPTRIDFRDLVKDLVRTYRTRIELRQIGVRHEAQMLGGIGNCGRVCCCHTYLRTFAPVTIKMAKEQNLFLNPAKLSGLCGRLLCCLSFEQSNYEDFNRRCPKLGKKLLTDLGVVKVIRANMFSQSLACILETGEEKEFTLEEWESLNPRKNDRPDVVPEPRKRHDSLANDAAEQPREEGVRPKYAGNRPKKRRSTE